MRARLGPCPVPHTPSSPLLLPDTAQPSCLLGPAWNPWPQLTLLGRETPRWSALLYQWPHDPEAQSGTAEWTAREPFFPWGPTASRPAWCRQALLIAAGLRLSRMSKDFPPPRPLLAPPPCQVHLPLWLMAPCRDWTPCAPGCCPLGSLGHVRGPHGVFVFTQPPGPVVTSGDSSSLKLTTQALETMSETLAKHS